MKDLELVAKGIAQGRAEATREIVALREAFMFAFAHGFKTAEETSRQCIPAMDDAWNEYQAIRALYQRKEGA